MEADELVSVPLEKATAHKDALIGVGMTPQVLEELGQALGEFEQTLEASRAGRREHVGASADLQVGAAEIGEQVRLLDGVVRYRFGDNAELVGAWASARNPSLRSGQAPSLRSGQVVLGPFRPKAQPEAGSEPKAA